MPRARVTLDISVQAPTVSGLDAWAAYIRKDLLERDFGSVVVMRIKSTSRVTETAPQEKPE